MTPWIEVALDSRHVGATVLGGNHELEHGAIVPEPEAAAEVVRADVGDDPGDAVRRGEAVAGALERLAGDVGHGDVRVAAVHELGREVRRTAPDIGDRRVERRASSSIIANEARGAASNQLTASGAFSV